MSGEGRNRRISTGSSPPDLPRSGPSSFPQMVFLLCSQLDSSVLKARNSHVSFCWLRFQNRALTWVPILDRVRRDHVSRPGCMQPTGKRGPHGIVSCFPENGTGTKASLLVLSHPGGLGRGPDCRVRGSPVRSVSETRGEAELQSPGHGTLGQLCVGSCSCTPAFQRCEGCGPCNGRGRERRWLLHWLCLNDGG